MEVSQDTWGSRTAQLLPSAQSQKVQATAVVKDRYFFKVTNTTKIDNVRKKRLTINQPFAFTLLKIKTNFNNDYIWLGTSFINSWLHCKTR